jgi:hypothetical protein
MNVVFLLDSNRKSKVTKPYFFLCLFALALFLRLCVEIFDLFLFLPLGIIVNVF